MKSYHSQGQGKCVIYVLLKNFDINNQSLIKTQQIALRSKLPFALAYCYQPSQKDDLKMLMRLERILNMLSIPLIMLLGESETSLSSLFFHTNPSVVIFEPNKLVSKNSSATLQYHPYSWPGVVKPIKELGVI